MDIIAVACRAHGAQHAAYRDSPPYQGRVVPHQSPFAESVRQLAHIELAIVGRKAQRLVVVVAERGKVLLFLF